jgi:hypothetical protein
MRRVILLFLCSMCLWSCASTRRYLGPTAHGYEFQAIAIPDMIFLPSDMVSSQEFPTSAMLSVQVHDVRGAPVDGVPVMLQFSGSECQGVLTLSARRAVTLQGQASFTLSTANTTGACRLAVRVDNVTQEMDVAVSNPPNY